MPTGKCQACSGRSRTSWGSAADGPANVSVRLASQTDFSAVSRSQFLLLESSVPGCHSGGGLAYTTSPSFIWASRKASFTSAVNSVSFVSEVCRPRVASSLMLSSSCWRKRLQPSRLPRTYSAHTVPRVVSAPTYH